MTKTNVFGYAVGIGFISYVLGVLVPNIGKVSPCTSTPLDAWTVYRFALFLVVIFLAGKASEKE